MAKLYFREEKGLVKLLLDSPDKKINSVAGKVELSLGVKVDQVLEANSLINFWLDKPTTENKTITFSGIIPGGYQGTGGQILSFRITNSTMVKISDAQVLLHDGLGTPAPVETTPFSFIPRETVTPTDSISPEVFRPEVSADPNLFAGQKFLVFQTQDKQSGIDHYEVKEGRGEWQRGESPHLLFDQTITGKILVKAVDLAGNERVVTVFSPGGSYLYYVGGSIIVAILCLIVGKKLFSRWQLH